MQTEETSEKERLEKFAALVGEAYRRFIHLELMIDRYEENHHQVLHFDIHPFRQLRFLKDFFEVTFERNRLLKGRDPVSLAHYAGTLERLFHLNPLEQLELLWSVTRYFFDGHEGLFMFQPNPEANIMAGTKEVAS